MRYEVFREKSFPTDGSEWDRLAEKHPAYSIFLSYDWLSTWWMHFGCDKELYLLYAKDENGMLAGIAPLIRMRTMVKGLPLYRRLSFVEGLETTYRDFIYDREHGEAVLGSFMEHLKRDRTWDVMELWSIRQDSPTIEILPRICDRLGLRHMVLPGAKSFYINLTENYAEYLAGLKRKVRQNLRHCQRRLEEIGATFHEQPSTSREGINCFIELHQRRWNKYGQPGVFGTPAKMDFYRDVLERLSISGRHRLFEIRVGERTVAAVSRFLYQGVMHSFLGGWDCEYAKYGVGITCVAYSIRRAIELGFKECDLSIGDYTYKRELATGWRENRTLFIFRTGVQQFKHCLAGAAARMAGKEKNEGAFIE